jgi:protein required for attachment to host cells
MRAMSKKEHADERVASDYARHIASMLKHYRAENRFSDLVLVAEPGFLGLLRDSLDGPTGKCVLDTVNKDLAQVHARDLTSHLKEVIRV